jgi:hypothetical protein
MLNCLLVVSFLLQRAGIAGADKSLPEADDGLMGVRQDATDIQLGMSRQLIYWYPTD